MQRPAIAARSPAVQALLRLILLAVALLPGGARPALALTCSLLGSDEEGSSSLLAVTGTSSASKDCESDSLLVIAHTSTTGGDGEYCTAVDEHYLTASSGSTCSSVYSGKTYYTYYRDRDADGWYDADGGLCCAVIDPAVSDATGPSSVDGTATGFTYKTAVSGEDCDDTDAGLTEIATFYPDADGDGYPATTGSVSGCVEETRTGYVQARSDGKVDCDDSNAGANPAADEVCDDDNVDEDCDGLADNKDSSATTSSKTRYYRDGDEDGFGDKSSSGTRYCDDPTSGSTVYSLNNDDCDDGDDTVNPDAPEICDDLDNDCDSTTDEDELAGSTWYGDSDEDGYGVASIKTKACEDPDIDAGTTEWVSNDDDCDDDDATSYPGASETCDGVYNNCSYRGGGSSAPTDEVDGDGDHFVPCEYASSTWKGSPFVLGGEDCDDDDDAVYPDADEVCDGQYNNCSNRLYSATTPPLSERDLDGDLYVACTGYSADDWAGDASVVGDGDCSPNNPNVYPGAYEVCDGEYDDCDDPDYDADSAPSDELDGDGDGYVSNDDCDMSEWTGDDRVDGGGDCDDDDETVYPGAYEVCDGQYNDCSASDYSGSVAPTDERDQDNDDIVPCEYVNDTWAGDPTVTGGRDCDDLDESVYPSAEEICDGQFNNCSDRAYSATSPPEAETDADGDHYVPCDTYVDSIWDGDPSVLGGDDCDDGDALVYPSAPEICDGEFNDCSDPEYDPTGAPAGETDGDGDGYVRDFCVPGDVEWHGEGTEIGGNDCDDEDPLVYPSADEICDGRYNDCSDPDYDADHVPVDERDRDSDGYVSCRYVEAIWEGDPSVIGGDDCEDLDKSVFPGATEVCDGQYNDCDARAYTPTGAPDDEEDADADGYVICSDFDEDTWLGDPTVAGGDDCNDDDGTVYPEAEEICDGQYNDCEDRYYDADSAPEEELDADEDGYVPCRVEATIEWAGAVEPDGGDDCDDDSETVFPGAPERCNGRYDDCDDPAFIFDLQAAPDDELDDDDDDFVECNYAASTWVGEDVTVIGGEDCDDADATVLPGGSEVCDGQYNDCDDPAYTDDDSPADEWDDDEDGFVECVRYASVEWLPFDGLAEAPENDWLPGCINNRDCVDCDDDDPAAYPGAAEAEDDLECMADADEDGYGDAGAADPVTAGLDCDDGDDSVFPFGEEVCEAGEQVDNDCNGDVNTWYDPDTDSDVPVDAEGGVTVYLDADGDGFGDPSLPYEICEVDVGFSLQPTDCDDADANRYPGAIELCNSADDDCDAEVDESADLDPDLSGCVDMFRDVDRDGYGDYDVVACLCRMDNEASIEDRGDVYVISGGDCDDTDDEIHPLSCRDGIDNDGDGAIDGVPGGAEGDPDCTNGYDELGTVVEVRIETIDGNDDDCDGFVAMAELDCDDDGAFAALPTVSTVGETAEQFGLSSCGADVDGRLELSCWGETLGAECDDESGLWVFRYDESDDGWGGRYLGGRRVWATTTTCDSQGDCDDQCASRCPGAEETCDGIDNDCTIGGSALETDGLPAAMSTDVVLPGTVPLGEVDLDQDGYVTCDDFDAGGEQVVWVSGSCADAAIEGEDGDCDDLCSIEHPDTEERCDGLINVCDGPEEASDQDDDGHRVCGLGSGDDGEALVEDLYVVVWIASGESASTGGASETDSAETGTSETGAGGSGLLDSSGGVADSTPAYGGVDALIVPLVLPRPGAPDCDAELYTQLAAIVGGDALDAAVAAGDASALLEACRGDDGAWRCGLVRLSLTADADEDLFDNPVWIKADQAGYVSDACLAHPEQYVSRTVWSADRVRQARELVVESECRRLYGVPCGELSLPAEPAEGWSDARDLTLALDRDIRWWVELGRFLPESVSRGSLMTCWGEPTGRDPIAQSTGGDCADDTLGANRDEPEGPGDLVVSYRMASGELDGPPDCSACVDGIDNNCDGQVDCADPSCAVCFVGVGGGCAGAEGDPCATASCSASPDSASGRWGAALVTLLLTGAAAARRRR